MSTIFPEFERQLVSLAQASAGRDPTRSGRLPRGFLRGLVPVLTVAGSLAIVIVALVVVRPGGRTSGHSAGAEPTVRTLGGSAPPSYTLAQLKQHYPVLARAQSATDRSQAGAVPVGMTGAPLSSFGASAANGNRTVKWYHVRYVGLAHHVAIPSLTRVIDADGVRVSLFVGRLVHSKTLPRAIVTGTDRKAAASFTTVAYRRKLQRLANRVPEYVLWARASGGHAVRINTISSILLIGARARDEGETEGAAQVVSASLKSGTGRIVAVEPAGVARVTWSWPREFDTHLLTTLPALRMSAPVVDGVAVAPGPRRFTDVFQLLPDAVTLHGPRGQVSGQYTDIDYGAKMMGNTTWDPSYSGPQTAQSRAAERNPATPNRVVVQPATIKVGGSTAVFFRVLISHVAYYLRITGGPHPDCLGGGSPNGEGGGTPLDPLDESFMRGDTYTASTQRIGIECPGTYTVSLSVMRANDTPYPPFGSARLTVR